MNPTYVAEDHGCVYALVKDQDSDGDFLIHTPLFTDGNYNTDQDEWDEVDEMALLGEDQIIQDRVNFIFDYLQQAS